METTTKPVNPLIPKQVAWYDDRFYQFEFEDGKIEFFASVTTKLGIVAKSFLAKWRGDVGNAEADRVMMQAQDRGTRIHSAFETLCKGGIVIFNPKKKPVYKSEEILELAKGYPLYYIVDDQSEMHDAWKLQEFLNIVKPKVLFSEVIVYDIENKDAGTVDAVLEIKEGTYFIDGSKPVKLVGGVYVADLKSGKTVDSSAYKQMACYAKCAISMGLIEKEKVVGTLVLHTGAQTRSGIEGFSAKLRTAEEVETDYAKYRRTAAVWQDENENFSPKVFDLPSFISYKVEA